MDATLKYNISARLVEDNVEVEPGIKPGVEGELSEIGESSTPVIKIPASTDDLEQSVALVGPLKFLLIETDQNISVKFNADTNDAMPINAAGSPKRGVFMVTGGPDIESIFFSNPGNSEANVKLFYGS